jgi:SAM-dependent methyltransferase
MPNRNTIEEAIFDHSMWQPKNDRETCVCGTTRQNIPDRLYRAVAQHDYVWPPYFYRCTSCGTLSAVNLFFNVESYSRVPIEAYCIPDLKWQLNRARVDWLRARTGAEFPDDPVVYDLGSGEGCFTACVCEAFPQARVVAVESDERMRQRFATEYQAAEFVPKFIETFLKTAPKPGADLIILTDVLEHVVEPESLLGLIADALKPSGFAYITLPNADSLGSFPHHIPASEIDWNLANWTCQHLWMIKPRLLNEIINRRFTLREMSRTFETNIRRDGDYSTFLVQRVRCAIAGDGSQLS